AIATGIGDDEAVLVGDPVPPAQVLLKRRPRPRAVHAEDEGHRHSAGVTVRNMNDVLARTTLDLDPSSGLIVEIMRRAADQNERGWNAETHDHDREWQRAAHL